MVCADLMQRNVGSDMVCPYFKYYRLGVLSELLPGCPTCGSGGGSKERVWWQVVWYQALSSEHWSAESSQDGQEEER